MSSERALFRAYRTYKNNGLTALLNDTVGFLLRHYKYNIRCLKVKKNFLLSRLQYSAVANPYKNVTVDPAKIKKYLNKPWNNYSDVFGGIVGGEWDIKRTHAFRDHPLYISFDEHFREGIPWKDTNIANYRVRRLKERYDLPYKGCETWEDVKKYLIDEYEKYDDLYDDIKKNGFKIVPDHKSTTPGRDQAPYLCIGRDGEFILAGKGYNRVAIAKVLDLDEIPVLIYTRHKKWQETRELVHKNGIPNMNHTELKNHPDLQDILTSRSRNKVV